MALERFGSAQDVSIFFFVLGILGVGMSLAVPWLVRSLNRRGTFLLGVVIGVVGVSNLLKWLLARYNKVTMGVLLGLLLGAVVGIWPFQQVVRPGVGDTVGGTTLTAADIKQLDPEQWPVVFFDPTVSQVTIALLLIGGGLAVTWLIALVGGGKAKNAGAA